MVLPNSQPVTQTAGLQHQRPPYKSYANAVKGTQRVSLLHENEIQPPPSNATNSLNTLQTKIFRPSQNQGALLFDISHCRKQYTDQQALVLLATQHPNALSCVLLNDGPRRYLEMYIRPDSDDNDIMNNGVVFEDCALRVLPCKALSDDSKVVTVKLSHLPLCLTRQEVYEGLKQSLAPYGAILDVGIYTEPASKLFMGTGYVVLDTNTTEGMTISNLQHVIPWMESDKIVFHATWNNMPTWCRYCHKENHTKFECELSKARIVCYSCHESGHRSFHCPRKNINPAPFKKTKGDTNSKSPSQTPDSKTPASSDGPIHQEQQPKVNQDSADQQQLNLTFIAFDPQQPQSQEDSSSDEDMSMDDEEEFKQTTTNTSTVFVDDSQMVDDHSTTPDTINPAMLDNTQQAKWNNSSGGAFKQLLESPSIVDSRRLSSSNYNIRTRSKDNLGDNRQDHGSSPK